MSKKQSPRVSRHGAYIVKAAESRPSRVTPKSDARPSKPSEGDKVLARALMKSQRP